MAKDKARESVDMSKDVPVSEVEHLRRRVHDMEEAVHTYLSHQTSVGHERISSWLDKVKHRFAAASTPPVPEETSPDTASGKTTEGSSGSSI